MFISNFKAKSFAIYGLGITGKSALNFLKKKKVKKIFVYDDKLKVVRGRSKKNFANYLNFVDFIILSPGISINKSKFKKVLKKNKNKIITDLDLFFLSNKVKKSIIVTGSNGKSTTCSIIFHVLKQNKINSQLVGNIGKPILNFKASKKKIFVIEASSFQLQYSKFIKPYCAIIINISKDHLDWHGTMNNYINAKLNIFKNQSKYDKSIVNNLKIKKLFKKKGFKGKLIFLKKKMIYKNEIKNKYLKTKINQQNIDYAFKVSKLFNISKNNFLNSLKNFRGLEHRHEVFLETKNFKFINDSKATSFEASKHALLSSKNIIWILGGLPKEGDCIKLNNVKKNILKAYIISKYSKFFKSHLEKEIICEVMKNLKETLKKIYNDKKKFKEKVTVLFSPASASYDKYKNFEERGNDFKKIVKYNAKNFY